MKNFMAIVLAIVAIYAIFGLFEFLVMDLNISGYAIAGLAAIAWIVMMIGIGISNRLEDRRR